MTPAEQRLLNKLRSDRIYPCRHKGCTVMRSENEGGRIFTVCDKHWDEWVAKAIRERLEQEKRNHD